MRLVARDFARGTVKAGVARKFYGPTPVPFEATVIGPAVSSVKDAVTVRVSGSASYVGRSTYITEESDPLTRGFTLPETYAELMKRS